MVGAAGDGAAVHPRATAALPRAGHRRLRRLLHGGGGFLALAHTLKRGEHIRVTLLLSTLQGPRARGLEIWAHGAAVLLAVLLAFYSCRLAWQSRASTTSPPATTPRRCGSRSSPWRRAR
jgi:TRAP-type C4-dicarboxylate transport system permease small subunit